MSRRKRWHYAPPPGWLGPAAGELRRTAGPVQADMAEIAATCDDWRLEPAIEVAIRAAAVAGVTGCDYTAAHWREWAVACVREAAWRRARYRAGPAGGTFNLNAL